MIEKTNLPIVDKLTKKIEYWLNLDRGFWLKAEYDSRGNEIYYVNSFRNWVKKEYNTIGDKIYQDYGVIKDNR